MQYPYQPQCPPSPPYLQEHQIKLVSNQCCWWRDVSHGAVAAGMFTFTVCFIQLLLWLYIWPMMIFANYGEYFAGVPSWHLMSAPAIIDLLMSALSVAMLAAVSRNKRGLGVVQCWLVCLPIYLIWEIIYASVGFYLLANYVRLYTFSANLWIKMPYVAVLPVYLAIKLAINIGGEVATFLYYRKMRETEAQIYDCHHILQSYSVLENHVLPPPSYFPNINVMMAVCDDNLSIPEKK